MSEQQPAPRACQGCGGNKGQIVDTSSDGVTRQNWQTCQACGGTGVQGGGI
jgi:DnaJ-class molecular chaperone